MGEFWYAFFKEPDPDLYGLEDLDPQPHEVKLDPFKGSDTDVSHDPDPTPPKNRVWIHNPWGYIKEWNDWDAFTHQRSGYGC